MDKLLQVKNLIYEMIKVNIQIMRTFVQLRQWVLDNKDFGRRFLDLEQYFMKHCRDNDSELKEIYAALDLLMGRTKPYGVGFIKDR